MPLSGPRPRTWALYVAPAAFAVALMACVSPVLGTVKKAQTATDSGPAGVPPPPIPQGDAEAGRIVYDLETFGTEGFWTNAVRMPQGMAQAKVTPIDALKVGLSVNSERIPAALLPKLAAELKTDLSPKNAPLLNNPTTTTKLVNANAIIGIVARNGKVGVSCALCHAVSDTSVFSFPNGGGIGKEVDGPTQHNLNVGKLLSIGANSRALFTTLQLAQPDGSTIGRAPKGLTAKSTEAEVDAYLSNPKYYPIGMFDDSPDGNGNPVHITPFFRQDLAAPYGSSGQNAKLEDFNNTVYTVLFDQTNLTTPGGHAFIKAQAGAAGLRMLADYEKVLKATGVKGYPYVQAAKAGMPGKEPTPVGERVNNKKLLDLNAYLVALQAPKGVVTDAEAVSRGRAAFEQAQCTACHNTDSSKPVYNVLIPMTRIYPGYLPKIIAKRPPLDPVQNAPGTFDDKMIVIDASGRGGIRGNALPLLLDLARKPVFLHDDSVHSLNELLNPQRGTTAPHPYYVPDVNQRNDVIAFLKSLDTQTPPQTASR